MTALKLISRSDRVELTALGTTAVLVVTEPRALDRAEKVLRRELVAVDEACSRFRADSEISRLHRRAGSTVVVGPLLAEALSVAMRAAALTDGLVDPTVGDAVRALGYDRDFADVEADHPEPPAPARPAPGWWRVAWNPATREVLLPRGVTLDLGATAKAMVVDRIAVAAAERAGCGVLVGVGGDVRVAGPAPGGGWRLGVGDDHAQTEPDVTVTITGGGLATSGTTRRTWRRAGRAVHHIVDPHTGDVPAPAWRTVTVAAATCVDANIASTASIVMGDVAPGWLAGRRLPARLVTGDGEITTTAGWPAGQEG
jgi:thiamine biosynthesis lipoprotein